MHPSSTCVSNINRHKGKVPLKKESVKKKHTLWKRYMRQKGNTILNIVKKSSP